jgi:hypothetical protein
MTKFEKSRTDPVPEQTFLVETHLSPDQWKANLAYKIRLDTNNDPSGQIDVLVDPRRAARDYWVKVERMSEYYDYYQENYLVDDNFQWCGLARLAGSQVISGVSDASYATLSPSAILTRIADDIFTAMAEGGYDIFDSLAWQHHAYRGSGLGALEWTDDNSNDNDLDALIDSWREFDDGVNTGNANSIADAALEMTRHEQQEIIVPTWTELREITLESGDVTHVYTVLAENVMKPNGDRFTVAVPGGNLASTFDRWKWIDDSPTGSPNGIIGAWKAAGKAGQRALVNKKLKNDSLRFSQMQVIIDALPLLTRMGIEAEIRVNDYLDQP